MSYSANNNDRRRGTSSSRLFERYDVNINIPRSGRGSYSNRRSSSSSSSLPSVQLIEPHERHRRNQRLLLYLAIVLVFVVTYWITFQPDDDDDATPTNDTSSKIIKAGSSYVNMNLQKKDHKEQPSTNYDSDDELALSSTTTKRQKSTREEQLLEQQQILDDIKLDKHRKKRWNPCLNTKYELERHDYETNHGDVCRVKGGLMGLFECPDGCHETAGTAPYCANDNGGGIKTNGHTGGPCRVRNPDAPPEYRCDDGGVCIMAVGTPKSQFKGEGVYYDDSCDGQCGNGREGVLNTWISNGRRCNSDWDCSLAGTCTPEGQCQCDPWAEGVDCSYLKFQPVNKARLGYLNEQHTSWGGSIVQSATTGFYHMFVSEILCKVDPNVRKRCGLSAWQTHSQIVEATSAGIDGPYKRLKEVLPPEHHNPSVHVSPTTGYWHLFSISGPSGPIERMISTDEGKSWGNPITISPEQNPGPLLMSDGSTRLYFRGDGMNIPSPTCSDEGISMQVCPSENEQCLPSTGDPIISHTGEDPSVFVDHRGNYHMLFNALPYKCVPKFQQGGHAWSRDGIEWSSPRVGAFNTTIQFSDGSNIKCERRERPQMVLDKDGMPLALISAVTGCPRALGGSESGLKNNPYTYKYYKGGDDAFTLIQKMGV
ncbi:hypothetical protein ACHAXM_002205 [Skeletonema potamos]